VLEPRTLKKFLSGSLKMASNIMRVRIPLERIGVLIGTSGRIKMTVESKFDVKIDVEGSVGEVSITLNSSSSDPVGLFRARDIILAIGRGFSPERAFKLFSEEATLVVIDLREIFGKSESDISRVKGRIIGRNGKARRLIEEMSGASICVYGHSVAIIGDQGQYVVAKEAIERLIRGDQHKSVYDFLQRKRRELRLKEAEIWKESAPFSKPLNNQENAEAE
jgi:ribosomal RNA assembly protein